jgi:hypothetical protein
MTLIIPSNHGIVVSIACKKWQNDTIKYSADTPEDEVKYKEARITCSGDMSAPCVHSRFTGQGSDEDDLGRRVKRGITEARNLLAALDAQRATFPVARPTGLNPLDGAVESEGFQRRSSMPDQADLVVDSSNNATMGNTTVGGSQEGQRKRRVPYRVRQKAALIYKILYEQVSEQLINALRICDQIPGNHCHH